CPRRSASRCAKPTPTGASRRCTPSARRWTPPSTRPTRCWPWRAPMPWHWSQRRWTCRRWPRAWRASCGRWRQRGIDLGLEALEGAQQGPALGHAALLHEALANLLHNALVQAPRGGRVTLQAGVRGGRACLAVLDDGPGMPAAERARVGERCLRVEGAAVRGSGLGLAIAHAIAQRHGGTLVLEDARPGAAPPGLAAWLQWPAGTAHQG